jgi:hypothetical protein
VPSVHQTSATLWMMPSVAGGCLQPPALIHPSARKSLLSSGRTVNPSQSHFSTLIKVRAVDSWYGYRGRTAITVGSSNRTINDGSWSRQTTSRTCHLRWVWHYLQLGKDCVVIINRRTIVRKVIDVAVNLSLPSVGFTHSSSVRQR